MATLDTVRVFAQVDNRLANDNAVGRIYVEGEEGTDTALLIFPGRDRPKAASYGPFTQEGNLDGILIAVGGKDETVPIRLQNGTTTSTSCETTRDLARELGKHLFEPIRIFGTGQWIRETDGTWSLLKFRLHRFDTGQRQPARYCDSLARCTRQRLGWTTHYGSWTSYAMTKAICTK